jgi:hypothetical protein
LTGTYSRRQQQSLKTKLYNNNDNNDNNNQENFLSNNFNIITDISMESQEN